METENPMDMDDPQPQSQPPISSRASPNCPQDPKTKERDLYKTKLPNQEPRSKIQSATEDPAGARQFSPQDLAAAIVAALEQGPILAWQRVDRAIREACPEMAASWAPAHVARLVAEGSLPETEVMAALAEYGQATANRPIVNRAGYLAAILARRLRKHGLPWRKAV